MVKKQFTLADSLRYPESYNSDYLEGSHGKDGSLHFYGFWDERKKCWVPLSELRYYSG